MYKPIRDISSAPWCVYGYDLLSHALLAGPSHTVHHITMKWAARGSMALLVLLAEEVMSRALETLKQTQPSNKMEYGTSLSL